MSLTLLFIVAGSSQGVVFPSSPTVQSHDERHIAPDGFMTEIPIQINRVSKKAFVARAETAEAETFTETTPITLEPVTYTPSCMPSTMYADRSCVGSHRLRIYINRYPRPGYHLHVLDSPLYPGCTANSWGTFEESENWTWSGVGIGFTISYRSLCSISSAVAAATN